MKGCKSLTSPFDYIKMFINSKGDKFYRSHHTNILSFYNAYKGTLACNHLKTLEDIDINEHNVIEQCYNGGLSFFHGIKNQEYEVLTYDFKMSYPKLMSGTLTLFKQTMLFDVPLSKPTYHDTYTIRRSTKTNKYIANLQTGLYYCEFDKTTLNNSFIFQCKNNYYTDTELNYIISQQTEETEFITGPCAIYERCADGSQIFNAWFNRVSDLKKEMPNNGLVKMLASSLWGHLSNRSYKWYTNAEITPEMIIAVNKEDITENHTHLWIDEIEKQDGSPLYKLLTIQKPYKHNLARIKPFITAIQRVALYKILEHFNEDQILRYNTDSISFNKAKLSASDIAFIDKISSRFILEAKTTGKLFYHHNKWNLNGH